MNNPGWSCPKCGSVYAPWVKRCEECPKARELAAYIGTTDCGCPKNTAGEPLHHTGCPLSPWSNAL